jgi:hypothetical protein
MKLTKATYQQQREYKGLYPLAYTAKAGGVEFTVERLPDCGPYDPKYEAVFPKGFVLAGDNQHIVLADSLKDLRELIGGKAPFAKCECDGCRKQ